MKKIYCGYLDLEVEEDYYDAPFEPTLEEAISFFNRFGWTQKKSEFGGKSLAFQTDDGSMLTILKFGVGDLTNSGWDISALSYKKRKFLGPFFKKEASMLLSDSSKQQVEKWLEIFYNSTFDEYFEVVKSFDFR